MSRKQLKSMALGIGAVNAIRATDTATAGAIIKAIVEYVNVGKEPTGGEIDGSLWAVLKAEADEIKRISELRKNARLGKTLNK